MSPNVHLTCLCGSWTEPSSLLKSQSFPIEYSMCHCFSCRVSSGGTVCTFAPLASSPSESTISKLQPYKFSEQITRYFCPKCGCHCFVHTHAERGEWWSACSGIIESPDDARTGLIKGVDNVVKVIQHDFVEDTQDGGFACRFSKLGKDTGGGDGVRDVPCYAIRKDGQVVDPKDMEEKVKSNVEKHSHDEKLHAECRCGEIKFFITRPKWEKGSRWQGILVPLDRSKYHAEVCVCRFCRLGLGFSMMPWCYVQAEQIFVADEEKVKFWNGSEESLKSNLTNLGQYRSSKDCLRSFCKTCGATVFYECKERTQIIDISVGILRSPTGAMARDWLSWPWNHVSWKEEAMDKELLGAVLD